MLRLVRTLRVRRGGPRRQARTLAAMPNGNGTTTLDEDARTWSCLSWNVAGRVAKLEAQLHVLERLAPDLLTLQEITARTVGPFTEGLVAGGLTWVISSFEAALEPTLRTGPRRYGQIVASRWPVLPLDNRFEVPWPERITSAVVDTPFGEIEIHTTHVPPGASNGWIKVETLEGLVRGMAVSSPRRRILTGDFNAPQAEMDDGTVYTWAHRERPVGVYSLRRDRGQRWHEAELAVVRGLADWDLGDVFRLLNGPGASGFTWYTNHGRKRGRRFDHIYASAALQPRSFKIHDDVRRSGLSDHAAIEARFAAGNARQSRAD